MKKIFHNGRELRAGWRLILFCMVIVAIGWAGGLAIDRLPLDQFHGLHPVPLLVDDVLLLLDAMIATVIMGRIEKRTLAIYGIPGIRELIGRKFWIGVLWGFAMTSAVIATMFLFGGYHVNGLNFTGAALLKYGLLWLLANILIGLSEEIAFRGYFMYTLSDGIGFWNALIFESIGFGALHYFTKPYERWEDWVAVSLITVFITLALRRTGSLAFPIGMHAAFDFAFIYIFSGRNGGDFAAGRLLNAEFPGPNWLTGGKLGPEASWLMFPVAIAATIFLNLIYRQAKWPSLPGGKS